MQAANASVNAEFGKQWQGQMVDGRFALEQYLGGSEQTAVFLTRFPAAATGKAAIKLVLASTVDSEAALANWKRAAQLSHPHLMPVLDGGRTSLSGQQLLFVVTEFAEENLAQVIPQRALTVAEVDAMLRPTLAALAYLHDHGLVHGHVRPANVMAVGDQLKLSSDGVRPAGAAPRKSQASAYDAPEIASGQSSAAVDIWSLGAMLVESLTRQMPRIGNEAQLPQPFAEVARHCLVGDPARRWTAEQIAGAIRLPLDRTPKQEAAKAFLFAWRLLHHESAPPANGEVATSEPATRTAAPNQQAPAPARQQPSSANQNAGVVRRVMPNASRGALNTIQGRVKVRLKLNVDTGGNVADARFISAGPSKYFSRIAMEAARQWKFAPASSSEWNLLFEFSRGGVEAFLQPVKESR